MKKRELIEQEIIGNLLVNEKRIPEVSQIITADDFLYYNRHFTIIFTAWQKNQNVTTELIAAGVSGTEIADLMGTFGTRPLSFAAKELKALSTSHRIKSILAQAANEIPSEDIDLFVADLQQRIIENVSETSQEKADIESLLIEFKQYREMYIEKRKSGQELLGISTGYSELDKLIDGLRPEHLIVLGGYSSTGKTFAALNIATHLMRNNHRTVFYSLEMSRVDIVSRVLGLLTRENGSSVAKGWVDDTTLIPALKTLSESNFAVYNEKHDLGQILLSMYEETIKGKVDLFVIDFLQLVKVKNARSEYETTTQAILEFQKAAKRFKVPVIVLSQVSNDSVRQGGDTLLMGFKGSGGIAAAADLAIELSSGEDSIKTYREKLNEGKPVCVKWNIRKNRHGRVGFLEMEFTGKTGVFEMMTLLKREQAKKAEQDF